MTTKSKKSPRGRSSVWNGAPEQKLIHLLKTVPSWNATEMANVINKEFKTKFTRVAILGKKWRLKREGKAA